MNVSIWNEDFWLPHNVSWNDFHRLEQRGVRLPQAHDLLYVYPLAGVLYLARLFFESYIAQPFGRLLGIHDPPATGATSARQPANGKRVKRAARVGPLGKFSESTWRFTFYLSIFLYGVAVVKDVSIRRRRRRRRSHSASFLFSFEESLDVGHAPLLARPSQSRADERCLLVLHDRVSLLLVTGLFSVHRREKKGLLADVHSSHRHDLSALVFLHR